MDFIDSSSAPRAAVSPAWDDDSHAAESTNAAGEGSPRFRPRRRCPDPLPDPRPCGSRGVGHGYIVWGRPNWPRYVVETLPPFLAGSARFGAVNIAGIRSPRNEAPGEWQAIILIARSSSSGERRRRGTLLLLGGKGGIEAEERIPPASRRDHRTVPELDYVLDGVITRRARASGPWAAGVWLGVAIMPQTIRGVDGSTRGIGRGSQRHDWTAARCTQAAARCPNSCRARAWSRWRRGG